MEPKEYIDALRREGAALAAAADGRLMARVPSCPEWDVAELVWHIGYVHDFWREIVARRLQAPEVERPPRPPVRRRDDAGPGRDRRVPHLHAPAAGGGPRRSLPPPARH